MQKFLSNFQPTDVKFEFPEVWKNVEESKDEKGMEKNLEETKQNFKKWAGTQGGARRGAPPFFGL
jgi:lysyl-tRNA synthetase class I